MKKIVIGLSLLAWVALSYSCDGTRRKGGVLSQFYSPKHKPRGVVASSSAQPQPQPTSGASKPTVQQAPKPDQANTQKSSNQQTNS